MLLTMLYALLAMSVTISVFGIVNTLVLSVYERTREIGMLRAIGTSRRQMRRMVRYESVITSVIGGVLGTAVGIVFAYVVTTRYAGDGFVFSVPVRAARRPPRGRGDRRRAGGGASRAACGAHQHPGGHPPRVSPSPRTPADPPARGRRPGRNGRVGDRPGRLRSSRPGLRVWRGAALRLGCQVPVAGAPALRWGGPRSPLRKSPDRLAGSRRRRRACRPATRSAIRRGRSRG